MQPYALIFCSGAPLNNSDDKEFAMEVEAFRGKKIVSGGTTAKIIARELGRTVSVIPNVHGVILPPESRIYGIDIVSEGVITLGSVLKLLRGGGSSSDVAGRIAGMLVESGSIYMLIGRAVNASHFDGGLPVVLGHRVDIVGEIAEILRSRFHKEITIKYY